MKNIANVKVHLRTCRGNVNIGPRIPGHLGPGSFRPRAFHPLVTSIFGHFGPRTFWSMVILIPGLFSLGHFDPRSFQFGVISVQCYFGPGSFHFRTFWPRRFKIKCVHLAIYRVKHSVGIIMFKKHKFYLSLLDEY